jgi:hypothetical protein
LSKHGRLNANLKTAIAAIVASQEKANSPNEPEISGMYATKDISNNNQFCENSNR